MSEVKKFPSVMSKGYGIVCKDIMRNPNISIKGKGIYCYLASYCGRNGYAYPSRKKILYDLSIGTSAYYRHYSSLIENNILTVTSAVGKRNKYILNHNDIKAKGYGIVCKSVMTDREIDISAKALYGYLCTYAAVGEIAHPSKEVMLYHLNISDGTYQKLIHQLISAGYIAITQGRTYNNGTFSTNYYHISSDISEQPVISDDVTVKASNMENQDTLKSAVKNKRELESMPEEPFDNEYKSNNQHTSKPHTKNQDTIKIQDYNITMHYNHQSINRLISNVLYQESSAFEEIQIQRMINESCGITQELMQSAELTVQAIKVLCNFDERSKEDSWYDFTHCEIYCQTVTAIAELALCGGKTSCPLQMISCINNICLDEQDKGYSVSLEDFTIEFVHNYTEICKERKIKNHKAYMSVCIENELKTYLTSIAV